MILEPPKRKPRRMLQPTKDYIRAELKLAEAEIARKDEEIARLRLPWWGRFLRRIPRFNSPQNPCPPAEVSK